MSETDLGPLLTSKMQLAITISNGSPPTLSYWPGDQEFYHLLSALLLSVKSPVLAIILLSHLYLFISLQFHRWLLISFCCPLFTMILPFIS